MYIKNIRIFTDIADFRNRVWKKNRQKIVKFEIEGSFLKWFIISIGPNSITNFKYIR